MTTATLHLGAASAYFPGQQDYSSASASAKGINILHNSNSFSNSNSNSNSGPFALSDDFSSSIPKAPTNNSIHIGSLSNTLGGLSLAHPHQSLHPTTASSLSSGLYSYSNTGTNGSLSFGNNSTSSLNNSNNNSNGGAAASEEISTIFVVGFPDDMQEREFQNMFVFTPGFEAATLKIPNKDQQEDDAMTLGVNGINPRKQIIGFAKFRTHQEALQAKDVLSGRRVDAEKGSLLKAEMAKKNLHTRRGLSNELVATPGVNPVAVMPPAPIGINSNGVHNGSSNSKLPHPLQHRNSLAGSAAYDAFHSVPCTPVLPSDLLSPKDYPSSYDFYADVYAPNTGSSLSFAESFGGRHPSSLQQSQPDLSSSFLGRQSAFDMNRVDPLSMGSLSNNGGLAGSIAGSFPNSIAGSFNNSRPIGYGSSQRFQKSFADLDNDTSAMTSSYLSKSIPAHTERGFNNALFGNDDLSNNRFQGLPLNTASATALSSPSVPSPGIASPGFRVPVNPGDQNPPCNTLYVGNLPMNTSEDELRILFSRCVGYRRLCFRTKSNGPMCFVEFENVECATQALNDLYGNPLSNSVKGGIRLSFSKNPLGVRNSTSNQPSGLGNQLHNMNGAAFLDRRDSMTAMFEQHYQA
ncbi:hypothetical protein BGZ70_001286 [Mortierella alpina]|uniref:RRM domain-containing protein n=1 Tax=Mortierella alpina TaxID=64518 RepID=A0A9P6IY12_MORAP|nr:hypothetical protein BGZ70_001286 [Mortierella alpina]